jgi:hypothetical protein
LLAPNGTGYFLVGLQWRYAIVADPDAENHGVGGSIPPLGIICFYS